MVEYTKIPKKGDSEYDSGWRSIISANMGLWGEKKAKIILKKQFGFEKIFTVSELAQQENKVDISLLEGRLQRKEIKISKKTLERYKFAKKMNDLLRNQRKDFDIVGVKKNKKYFFEIKTTMNKKYFDNHKFRLTNWQKGHKLTILHLFVKSVGINKNGRILFRLIDFNILNHKKNSSFLSQNFVYVI